MSPFDREAHDTEEVMCSVCVCLCGIVVKQECYRVGLDWIGFGLVEVSCD